MRAYTYNNRNDLIGDGRDKMNTLSYIYFTILGAVLTVNSSNVVENMPACTYYLDSTYSEEQFFNQTLDALAYTGLISTSPNIAENYIQRGNIFFNMAVGRLAVADYTAAISVEPDHLDYYLLRANAYFFMGNYPQAVGDYQHIIETASQENGIIDDIDSVYAMLAETCSRGNGIHPSCC